MWLFLVYNMMLGRERIAAFHFERSGLGIAIYNAQTVRIQCTRINSLCRAANPQLVTLAHSCTHILTNIPTHQVFAELDIERTAMTVLDKTVERAIIEHHLSKVTAHVNTLKNPAAYFKKMSQSGLKYTALGVLLQYLQNQPREVKLYLEDIDFFKDTLLHLVTVGEQQLNFLQVTRQDLHPSLIKGKGHSKQGYSILSAYEGYLASTASKRILRYLLLNPTYDVRILEQRLEVVEWMRHNLRDQSLGKHFRNVHLLQGVLRKFGRMNAEEDDWRKLLKTLQAMVQMVALLKLPNSPTLVSAYTQNRHWQQLIQLYSIFKQTFEFSPLGVRSGIDVTLDQLKQTYDSMPHLLTLIAKQQNWQLDFRIVFLTQVGYLVKLDAAVQLPEEFHHWQLQFSNHSARFYSNQLTQALDREYGDIFGEIQDIEKKITFDMQALVVERQAVILDLYWQLCEIQCFWGVSQVSRSMARPKFSSEALILAHSWHPLLSGEVIRNHAVAFPQSQAPRHRVCNSQKNLMHTAYSNRCSILTGPNASGKTVYMKQIALAVYLAHVGFFVPASLAEIPLTDSILFVGRAASIYNEQSCGFHSELSSLSSLTQPYVLSSKSLVLIDELGSEIDYQNSLKLMYAMVQYLTNSKNVVKNRLLSKEDDEFTSPLVFIVSHLSEILNSKIIEQSYRLRFLTMMVEQEGISLYKVRPGLVARGYGIRAAKSIMPEDFIALSQKYLELLQSE